MRKSSLFIALLLICLVGIHCQLASAVTTGTTIQVNVCSPAPTPTITSPANGVSTPDASVAVLGTTQSGLTIEGSDNGQVFGSVVATNNTFDITAPLQVGTNNITITANNACGPSAPVGVTVYRTPVIPPPQPVQPAVVPPSPLTILQPSSSSGSGLIQSFEPTIVQPSQSTVVQPSGSQVSQASPHKVIKPGHANRWWWLLWLLVLALLMLTIWWLLLIYKRRRRTDDAQQ